ncbi:MAG: hypothetical protein ACE5IQ_00200 [Candidatus Methylomirabilales bacterium]
MVVNVKKWAGEVTGHVTRPIYFSMIVVVAWQLAWARCGPAAVANRPGLQEGLAKLTALDFEGAYRALRGIDRNGEAADQSERAKVLRGIIALGETVAHLRLLDAYGSQLASLGFPLRQAPEPDEGVRETLRSYVRVYRKKVGRWAGRLAQETDTIAKLSREVPVAILYAGVRDLPRYVQRGVDRLEVVRGGIVPVPSQAANIEEAEEYGAVLAAFALAVDREYLPPLEKARLHGMVRRSRLLFYSALWLANVADILRAAELRKAATGALDVVLRLEGDRPESVLRRRAQALLRRLGEGSGI